MRFLSSNQPTFPCSICGRESNYVVCGPCHEARVTESLDAMWEETVRLAREPVKSERPERWQKGDEHRSDRALFLRDQREAEAERVDGD